MNDRIGCLGASAIILALFVLSLTAIRALAYSDHCLTSNLPRRPFVARPNP
jgi:hypothetical protein